MKALQLQYCKSLLEHTQNNLSKALTTVVNDKKNEEKSEKFIRMKAHSY
jgi:hypothetical protein